MPISPSVKRRELEDDSELDPAMDVDALITVAERKIRVLNSVTDQLAKVVDELRRRREEEQS